MSDKTDIDTFLDRLDLYGPDFDRWPATEAAAGRRCVLEHAPAREAHAAAQALERDLAALRPAPADDALKARIMAAAHREAAARPAISATPGNAGLFGFLGRWFSIPALPGAIAIAASAAIGFMVSTGDIGLDTNPYEDGVEAIVFGDFDTGDTL